MKMEMLGEETFSVKVKRKKQSVFAPTVEPTPTPVQLSDNVKLSGLSIIPGGPVAGFDPDICSYVVSVEGDTDEITVTPTAQDTG